MGRPVKTLEPHQIAEVETLAAVLTVAQMADYFGIGRTTFFAIMEREREVSERYKKGKARAIGSIAGSLISKARAGDTTSMIFYLKTQAGWRETAVLEHADSVSGRSASGGRDTLKEMLDKIAERSTRIGSS